MKKKKNEQPKRKRDTARLHAVRDKAGKFTATKPKPETFWKQNNPDAFYAWLKDFEPMILTRGGKYEVYTPTDEQKAFIARVLEADEQGNFKHSIALNIQPRRHGKTVVFALIVLWLFSTRENFTVQLASNGEDHTRRTQYNLLVRIITHTKKLLKLVKEENLLKYEIRLPEKGNVIQRITGQTAATAFGDRLNLLWVSDFHAAPTLEQWNALQAALLDSEGSLCFIDSNVDETDGHVHSLQREADLDPSILCNYVHYRDLAHYCESAPPWIDRLKAKRLERTSLPADFKRDILGQRSDAKNALFPSEVIALCKTRYRCPVEDIESITHGRKYVIGGGLDRSKPWSINQDATIWTVTLKVASPEHGEPEYHILNQEKIFNASANLIKKAILRDNERYSLNNVVLENYEVSEIGNWLTEQGITNELVTATSTLQKTSFSEFRRIAAEGRLHFPEDYKDLQSEMSTFIYQITKADRVSFGHASQKFKDDRVYSLNWSIYATRETVLNLYVMGNIQCHNKTIRRNICFLMGGDSVPFCSDECRAYHQVKSMFKEYKRFRPESEINIAEFFISKVKVAGAKIYQAA